MALPVRTELAANITSLGGRMDKLLARCKREVEDDIAVMRGDLRDLQQPQLFKRWLRQQRQLSEMGVDFPYAADPYE